MESKKGDLDIPEFLKRPEPIKAAGPVSEGTMSDVDVTVDEEVAPASKPRKVRKANSKANGAAKTTGAVKAAPKAKKAAGKAAKGKAAAPKKAKSARKLVERDKYGFAVGTIRAKAAAMYASKTGATLDEVYNKVGSVQLNLLKACEAAGHKVVKKKEAGSGSRQVTRYFLR